MKDHTKNTFTLPVVRCLKCYHEWSPRRNGRPTLCPECKSRTWDEARKDDKPQRNAAEDKVVTGLLKLWRHGSVEQRKLVEQFLDVMTAAIPETARAVKNG
jgi:DNA-directed RNA polymerase subunit RPC12/RpoP